MARILIIEDDPQVGTLFCRVLEAQGHEVELAEDGDKGVRRFAESSFDLVVTDLVMPEKEGIETIRELKAKQPDVKIIAVSGGGRASPHGYLRAALALGARRALAKPVARGELLEAVDQLLAEDR